MVTQNRIKRVEPAKGRIARAVAQLQAGDWEVRSARLRAWAIEHRIAITVALLSMLLVWQWHSARMANLRADIAERDMELNARQALQLSEAMLKAQAAHERLERNISGYSNKERLPSLSSTH